ncbi:serine protease [Streptacidiphilus sp. EB129]|uniref:serine protease n=1 Tax=Streptacidiphilus sp. EB129 TaxID=3156262 RepID=UPI0035196BFD
MRRLDETLVRVCDLAGHCRGVAFPVDREGTLLTSHEVVDDLTAMLLTWPGGAVRRIGAAEVLPLPEYDLALLHTDAVLPPLALAGGHGTRLVTVPVADRALQGGIAGVVTARYAPADRWHLIADTWLLDLDQAPYGLPLEAGGAPVLDAESGAVVAVATVALRSRGHGSVLVVPLRTAAGHPAVADLLARNAVTVPGFGRALNLAGVLDITAATLGGLGPRAAIRVDRPDGLLAAVPHWPADRPVLAVVGEPGSGRSTELAALAVHRATAAHREPTVWLSGADLRMDDASLLDAVDRVLRAVDGRVGTAQVARLAADAHRPLLIVLDGPEELPPGLLPRLPEWSAETGRRLRRAGARLVLGCRPEFWEQAGRYFSAEDLHGTGGPAPTAAVDGDPPAAPPRLHLGDLPPATAAEAARRLGLRTARPPTHPLELRLYAEIRAARPELPAEPVPARDELFGAYLDLACLRIAERLGRGTDGTAQPRPAARPAQGRASGPPPRRARGRRQGHCRTATAAAGRVHEAARLMLGPGGGVLEPQAFDELFPQAGGWARAVLAEGLLVPAGSGYRFAHEEFSDWIQGGHLDLATALATLLGDREPPVPAPVPSRPVPRGAHRRGGPRGVAVPSPAPPPVPPGPELLPVPRFRIGPVREALLRIAGPDEPAALEPWLSRLVLRLDGPEAAPPDSEAHWWTVNLLTSTLPRIPDPSPQLPLLRALAARMAARARAGTPTLGMDFWTALRLPVATRVELLRLLARSGTPEPLYAVADLLRADPQQVLPALCGWLRDEQLAATALELLRSQRRIALDDLAEALVGAAHPRADALLRELAATEPSALCRAVDRWAHDPRPERHVAAAVHGTAITPDSDPDRALLRFAAEALLGRPGEEALHGAALAVLVADPESRGRHLPAAVVRYLAADALLPAQALAPALESHTALVLSGYGPRLRQPGGEAAEILRALGGTPAPRAQRAAAELVRDHLAHRPEAAVAVAGWLAARARHGVSERAVLLGFVRDLIADHPAPVRAAFLDALDPEAGPLQSELHTLLRDGPRPDRPMRDRDQAHGTL